MTQVIDFIGGEYRNRTGVHGFAIRYVTTPPTRLLTFSVAVVSCHTVCGIFYLGSDRSARAKMTWNSENFWTLWVPSCTKCHSAGLSA